MKKFLVALMLSLSCIAAGAKEIKLTADNTVVLRSRFDSYSVNKLKKDLLKLNASLKNGYPIYLVLYTPGGSIQKGLELFEFIKGLNRPVHTVTIFAASMGFQTVQSLGKRYILKYGVLMSHKARGGFVGEFGGGLSQLDSRYGLWLRRVDMLDKVTVSRTGGKQTLKSYRASYDNELWLNGPEAVEQGYADEVVTVSCDVTLTSKTTVHVFSMGFFRINVTFSRCPMILSPMSISGELLTNKGFMKVTDFLAQNGKFGKNCREKATLPKKDYYGNIVKGKPAQLCAYDKTLNLDKINKMIEEKDSFLNRDLRDHVEYSY